MTLIERLAAKGIKTYSAAPLWNQVEVLDTIKTGENCAVVDNTKYEGKSLLINEEGNTAYISLKSGVDPTKDTYSLVEFEASRDSAEYGIVKGSKKVFAV